MAAFNDSKPIIVNLSGMGRPSWSVLRRLGKSHLPPGVRLADVVDETFAINKFAQLIAEGIRREEGRGGVVDFKDVAAYVLGEIRKSC